MFKKSVEVIKSYPVFKIFFAIIIIMLLMSVGLFTKDVESAKAMLFGCLLIVICVVGMIFNILHSVGITQKKFKKDGTKVIAKIIGYYKVAMRGSLYYRVRLKYEFESVCNENEIDINSKERDMLVNHNIKEVPIYVIKNKSNSGHKIYMDLEEVENRIKNGDYNHAK